MLMQLPSWPFSLTSPRVVQPSFPSILYSFFLVFKQHHRKLILVIFLYEIVTDSLLNPIQNITSLEKQLLFPLLSLSLGLWGLPRAQGGPWSRMPLLRAIR